MRTVNHNLGANQIMPALFIQEEMTIQEWGDCLGLRISKAISELAHFEVGTPVLVQVTKEGMMIKRLSDFKKKFINPFSETDLVNELSPYTAHADELVLPLASELGEKGE